jgi:hypothetical protein
MVQSAPGGVWSSSQPLAFNGNNSISADPANPLHAIVVEQGYYRNPDVWETQDGGNTWQSYKPMQWAIQYVAFDPSDATGKTVRAGADFQFTGSSDGGLTWTQLTSAGDLRIIVPKFAGTSGLTIAGSDQGIFSSSDGGNSWTSMNGDLTTSLAYWMDISGQTIVVAMQDYAMISSFDLDELADREHTVRRRRPGPDQSRESEIRLQLQRRVWILGLHGRRNQLSECVG